MSVRLMKQDGSQNKRSDKQSRQMGHPGHPSVNVVGETVPARVPSGKISRKQKTVLGASGKPERLDSHLRKV